MPLPTTNLTAHFDASDTDQVFSTLNGGGAGVHTGTPSDGDEPEVWDDEGDGSAADICLTYPNVASDAPNFRSSTPLMQLPCLDFSGADAYTLFTQSGNTGPTLDTLISASGASIIGAIYVEAATLNNATPYANHNIIADEAGYFTVSVRTDGGGSYYLQYYNWDGNQDVIEHAISLNTSYVFVAIHGAGNLNLTIITDGSGSESSASPVASGDTEFLAGTVGLGNRPSASAFYNGRIGELALYDAALSGADLSSAKAYFYQKWFPAVSVPSLPPPMIRHVKGRVSPRRRAA